jgi:putative DNA primase/helicase
MNLYPDLPRNSLKTTGKIKALIAGDDITVEMKFGRPFQIANKAVFVFSANELPPVDDSTYAFWRRWEVIEFPNIFPKDHTFVQRLLTKDNLSGFLNIVLKEMDKIEIDGLKRTSHVEEVMEIWKARSNSSYAFIKENIEKSPGDYIDKDTLYSVEYTKWCEDNDLTPDTKNKFTAEMEKFGASIDLVTINRQRKRVFMGIRRKGEPGRTQKDKSEPTELDKFTDAQETEDNHL